MKGEIKKPDSNANWLLKNTMVNNNVLLTVHKKDF